jgi:RHS repeat-associated protein
MTSAGFTAPDANGGSLIAGPVGNDYEVRTTLTLSTSGGTYVQYLRATANARSGPAPAGTFYSVELSPTFSGTNCSASLYLFKKESASSPTMVMLGGNSSIPCRSGMSIRSVMRGSMIFVYADDVSYISASDSSLPTGQPGLGAWATPAGNNAIRTVALGSVDLVSPAPPLATSIRTSAVPNRIELQWQGADDGTDGIGVAYYLVQRTGGFSRLMRSPELTDDTVSASTPYSYAMYSIDFHGNWSTATTFSITTPGTGAIDARRIGVRPTGAYWGGAGEQIDVRSGNLNFTLPLVKAMGRGGTGVTFALSYNSQVWRQEEGVTWKLGADTGYGFGWRLQAGSIAPSWSDYYTLNHYVYMDATGAEYRLDINTNGVWTSSEGIYLSYEEATQRLYAPDGSFWVMGAVSSGAEEDAGTRYPTVIQDFNGNQCFIRYESGAGMIWTDTSARITAVEDVRAVLVGSEYRTFSFSYTADHHLNSIANHIATSETYNFHFSPHSLYSPWSQPFGSTTLLTSLDNPLSATPLTHTFQYESGAGELTRVIFPRQGELRWSYTSLTYTGTGNGGRIWRAVQNRTLYEPIRHVVNSATPALTDTHYIAVIMGTTVVQQACLNRTDGVGQKCWFFVTDPADWRVGLTSAFEERSTAWVTTPLPRREEYTWDRDPVGLNPYIASVTTKMDSGAAPPVQPVQSKTEQALDRWGNVLWSKQYDYVAVGQNPTLRRTYNNAYLATSPYTSRYIFNRLLSTTVTDATTGQPQITLVSNTYDAGTLTTRTGLREHDSANYGTSLTARGNVTTSTQPGATRNITYDITGTVVIANDNNGHSVTVETSSLTNYAAPDRILPNGVGTLDTRMSYSPFLAPTTVIRPNSEQDTIVYNTTTGRMSQRTTVRGAITNYSYDDANGMVTAVTGSRTLKSTPDGFGRTIKMETLDTGVTKSMVVTEYAPCACSPMGKLSRVSQAYSSGNPTAWTTYSYDGLGRTASVTLPDGSGATTYAYGGNTTTVTDAAGKWKKFTRDAVGNLVKVTEPDPTETTVESNYTYDALDHLKQVSMQRLTLISPPTYTTQTRTFVYDQTTQRLTSATNPETGTVTYTYKTDGMLDYKIDAKNQKVKYSYDMYGRVTQIDRYPISTGPLDPCQTVSYTYDNIELRTNYENIGNLGRLSGVHWGNHDATCPGGFQFDESYGWTYGGLMAQKELALTKLFPPPPSHDTSGTLVTKYFYDNEGRLQTYQPPNGNVQYAHTYDSLGRPTKLTQYSPEPTDLVSNTDYGPGNELKQVTYGVVTETRGYNANRQLLSIQASGTGLPSVNLQYTYPTSSANNGRITSASSTIGTDTEAVTYQYDGLNRLSSAIATGTVPYSYNYLYDGFGNRTQQGGQSLQYDASTNRLVGTGYSYDLNGNLTGTPDGVTYTYDVDNRLTSAGGAQYVYNAFNERLCSDNSCSSIQFRGAFGELLGTYQPNLSYTQITFTTLTTNLYFAGKLIQSQGKWVVQDRLGSVRANSVGERFSYYPYGEEKGTTTAQGREKFGTYFRDGTGLDYAYQRSYSSISGRFLTPDPYKAITRATNNPANPQSWNRYAYVLGDRLITTILRACWPPAHPAVRSARMAKVAFILTRKRSTYRLAPGPTGSNTQQTSPWSGTCSLQNARVGLPRHWLEIAIRRGHKSYA